VKLSGHEAEVLAVDWRRRREVVEAVEEKKGERVRREKKRRREVEFGWRFRGLEFAIF
jgi:hypothetical protein